MKYTIRLLCIIILSLLTATAITAKKIWLYSSTGDHYGIEITEFDSLSAVDPLLRSVTPMTQVVKCIGESFQLNIEAESDWIVTVNDSKNISLSKYAGTGNDVIEVNVASNPNAKSVRIDTITVRTPKDKTYKQTIVTTRKNLPEIPEVDYPDMNQVTVLLYNGSGNAVDCYPLMMELYGNVNNIGAVDNLEFSPINDYPDWFQITFDISRFTPNYENNYCSCRAYTTSDEMSSASVSAWANNNFYIDHERSTPDIARICCGADSAELGIYGSGIVYMTVDAWNYNYCIGTNHYNIKVKLPEYCIGENPFIFGCYDGKNNSSIYLSYNEQSGYWEAEIDGQPSNTMLFLSGQPVYGSYNCLRKCPEDESQISDINAWSYVTPFLGEETDIVLDYTSSKYAWSSCIGSY